MSAFLVSKAHIDTLVSASLAYGMITPGEADRAGGMLWDENSTSVNFRYDEDRALPHYTFKRTPVPAPVVVLKSIACLDYQSCEHKGWTKSEAKKFLAKLQAHAIASLDGYDNGPWGID